MIDQCVYDYAILKKVANYCKLWEPSNYEIVEHKLNDVRAEIDSKRDILGFKYFVMSVFVRKSHGDSFFKAFLERAKDRPFYEVAKTFVRIILKNDDVNKRRYDVSKTDDNLLEKVFGSNAAEARDLLGYIEGFEVQNANYYIKYANIYAWDILDRAGQILSDGDLDKPRTRSFFFKTVMEFCDRYCSKEVSDLIRRISEFKSR